MYIKLVKISNEDLFRPDKCIKKIIQCKGVKGFSLSGFDLLFDQNESKRTKQRVLITHQHMPMLVNYMCMYRFTVRDVSQQFW